MNKLSTSTQGKRVHSFLIKAFTNAKIHFIQIDKLSTFRHFNSTVMKEKSLRAWFNRRFIL